MDRFTPEKRRRIMASVRSHDTEPEKPVRSMLHRMGFRFRLHVSRLPGKPDIALTRHKKAVFVHGCFWHGHKNCSRAARPATNTAFWNKKIDGNMKRDARVKGQLRTLGWKICTVWQCQIRRRDGLQRKLKAFMSKA